MKKRPIGIPKVDTVPIRLLPLKLNPNPRIIETATNTGKSVVLRGSDLRTLTEFTDAPFLQFYPRIRNVYEDSEHSSKSYCHINVL